MIHPADEYVVLFDEGMDSLNVGRGGEGVSDDTAGAVAVGVDAVERAAARVLVGDGLVNENHISNDARRPLSSTYAQDAAHGRGLMKQSAYGDSISNTRNTHRRSAEVRPEERVGAVA